MTKRIEDSNGWYEIKDNPLSKVGVFPYVGSSIDPDGSLGLKPEEIYSVYRSQDELSDQECIDSFKLVPWIDDHEMLGKDMTPAEEKGVQGVVGEDVYFDDKEGILKGNIKFFSEDLLLKVKSGKKELSCGYRCRYEINSGKFQNDCYDVIQTSIRGNHLALVDEGRMGSDVAVLDTASSFVFTIDTKDLIMKDNEKATDEDLFSEDMDLPQVVEAVKILAGNVKELMEERKGEDEDPKKGEDEDEDEESLDADEEKAEDEEEEKAEDMEEEVKDEEDPKAKAAGMDSLRKELSSVKASMKRFKATAGKNMMKEISARDSLASRLSTYTGVFDHKNMTHAEVATYGAKKLGLSCTKDEAIVALDGFFHNRTPDAVSHALDSKGPSSFMNSYLKGEK